MRKMMLTIRRIVVLLSILIGLQACSSSGGINSAGAPAAGGIGTPGVSPDPRSAPSGDLVPAIVGIPSDPGPATAYRIGPHDLLKIEVFQVAELSSEERVNDAGFISMPLIGDVKVGGLTPDEAESLIERLLGQSYLQNPQVDVFVTEYASQDVTVTGNVKSPGVYPLKGKTTLLQAIALAGGFDTVAKEEEVVVFRQQEGGSVNAYVVDVEAIQEGKLTDPVLVGEDRVVVPQSGQKVFQRGVGRVLWGWVMRAPVY
jgi:polysaccharide export outer membrane protein